MPPVSALRAQVTVTLIAGPVVSVQNLVVGSSARSVTVPRVGMTRAKANPPLTDTPLAAVRHAVPERCCSVLRVPAGRPAAVQRFRQEASGDGVVEADAHEGEVGGGVGGALLCAEPAVAWVRRCGGDRVEFAGLPGLVDQ